MELMRLKYRPKIPQGVKRERCTARGCLLDILGFLLLVLLLTGFKQPFCGNTGTEGKPQTTRGAEMGGAERRRLCEVRLGAHQVSSEVVQRQEQLSLVPAGAAGALVLQALRHLPPNQRL